MQSLFRLLVLLSILALGALAAGAGILLAQSEDEAPACDLPAEQAQIAGALADFEALAADDPTAALAVLYQTGAAYQQLAARCGYALSQAEREALADFVLSLVDLPTILARNAVGTDVPAILAELAETPGDPIQGQLLYNSLEPAGDGATLGCSGCHEGENHVAPLTEGTWTRVTEIRLADPALADYTFEQYIVESIVLPNAYIPPDYAPNLMPDHFGHRLTIEDLADIVAYLNSQDQLLDAVE